MPNTVINKQYIDYNRLSRYNNFPVYYHTLDNKYVYGTTAYLDQNIPYTIYEVKNGDTIDSLALKFYNNPTYFWVICSMNPQLDAYSKLTEGQALKIPTMSALKFKLD